MKRWLAKAETTLGNHSDRLNAINIFPVADGDTGTNLYLTMRAAKQAIGQVPTDAPAQEPGGGKDADGKGDVGALLARAGQAAMEQAMGNSGTLFAVFLCAAA
jgi:dihydroxyacetone kinase-like predicted kinase